LEYDHTISIVTTRVRLQIASLLKQTVLRKNVYGPIIFTTSSISDANQFWKVV